MKCVDSHALLSEFFLSNFKCFEWNSVAPICWKKWRKAVLVVACNQLRVKNDYILPLNKYRYIQFSPNWRDIANSRKHFTKRIENGFSIPIDYFPLLPLKNQFRKHSSLGKKAAAWGNLSATQIFLSLSLIKMQRNFLGLCISKTKRGKDISETMLFSLFQRIKPGNFQFCIEA